MSSARNGVGLLSTDVVELPFSNLELHSTEQVLNDCETMCLVFCIITYIHRLLRFFKSMALHLSSPIGKTFVSYDLLFFESIKKTTIRNDDFVQSKLVDLSDCSIDLLRSLFNDAQQTTTVYVIIIIVVFVNRSVDLDIIFF